MAVMRHGISISIERSNDEVFLKIKALGKLTHEDYKVITPMINSALSEVKQSHVKVFFDGTELDGWDLRAAWDDFKIGLSHRNEFFKIAIYGNKNWLAISSEIGSWFISGETKYFEKQRDALAWLNA
jgi:hypothetical protein